MKLRVILVSNRLLLGMFTFSNREVRFVYTESLGNASCFCTEIVYVEFYVKFLVQYEQDESQ